MSVWYTRQECVGSATEGFLVGELEERGRLEIRFSGKDGTTGVNEDYSQFLLRCGVSLVGLIPGLQRRY